MRAEEEIEAHVPSEVRIIKRFPHTWKVGPDSWNEAHDETKKQPVLILQSLSLSLGDCKGGERICAPAGETSVLPRLWWPGWPRMQGERVVLCPAV